MCERGNRKQRSQADKSQGFRTGECERQEGKPILNTQELTKELILNIETRLSLDMITGR